MDKMRDKYKEIYEKSLSEGKKGVRRSLTESETRKVDITIADIQNSIEEMSKVPKTQRVKYVKQIMNEVKSIQGLPLSIDYLEMLAKLLQNKEFEGVIVDITDRTMFYFNQTKGKIISDLATAIDEQIQIINDIEKLSELDKRLPLAFVSKNMVTIGGVKNKIRNKIMRLTQENALYNIRNNISENVGSILEGLTGNDIELEKMQELLQAEITSRLAKKNKEATNANEEHERRQVIIQIKSILTDRAKEYRIVQPENTIMGLYELSGSEDLQGAIRTVVKNFSERKDFDTARKLCEKYLIEYKEQFGGYKSPIYMLNEEIKNAQIGDFILRGLQAQGSVEDEINYVQLIQKGLRNKSLRAIPLGKSKDGARNITLADIWEVEIERE